MSFNYFSSRSPRSLNRNGTSSENERPPSYRPYGPVDLDGPPVSPTRIPGVLAGFINMAQNDDSDLNVSQSQQRSSPRQQQPMRSSSMRSPRGSMSDISIAEPPRSPVPPANTATVASEPLYTINGVRLLMMHYSEQSVLSQCVDRYEVRVPPDAGC